VIKEGDSPSEWLLQLMGIRLNEEALLEATAHWFGGCWDGSICWAAPPGLLTAIWIAVEGY